MSRKGKLSITNFIYGFGAAIVIVGALFKIEHLPYASLILTIGMIVEAGVFLYSAFERQSDDLDWSLVFPELNGGRAKKQGRDDSKEAEKLLSQKLDHLLNEAKLDSQLMNSFKESLTRFEESTRSLGEVVEVVAANKKYGEELALAAAQMESLNNLYKIQMEGVSRQSLANEESVEKVEQLKDQMENLTHQLSSLNRVYGGMLSAMNDKRKAS